MLQIMERLLGLVATLFPLLVGVLWLKSRTEPNTSFGHFVLFWFFAHKKSTKKIKEQNSEAEAKQ